MKKTSLFDRLRQWDAASFDLTDALRPDQTPDERPRRPAWNPEAPVEPVARRQEKRFFRLYPILAALLLTALAFCLLIAVLGLPAFGAEDAPAHNEVMQRYLVRGLTETGAVNAVAGVILDYRAFDTLGESHVLFTAVVAVMILLLGTAGEIPAPHGERLSAKEDRDPVLTCTARVLVPIILLFGIYVILNGHLGPGGGFSGGAILGGGLILFVIGRGFAPLERYLSLRVFRAVTLLGLCFYSLAKCYSFYCGANHLETIFTTGTPGDVLSAGLILPLNIAVGVVVTCTMYGFYSMFRRGRI